MRIDFHAGATEELEDSANWYAKQSEDAARGFVLAVDEAITKISDHPDRYQKVDERHRACSLVRYPFQIIYRNDGTRLYVIAIAHAKRRPGYWKSRA